MNAGTVEFLLILGGNPVYTAPVGSQLRRRRWRGCRCARISASTRTKRPRCATGTSRRRTSSKPGATSASDDGTVTIIQPLIAPLYGGKSAHEVDGGAQRSASGPATTSCASTGRAERVVDAGPPHAHRRSHRAGRSHRPAPTHRRRHVAPARRLRRARPPPAPRRCGSAGAALSPFDREWRKWLHDGVVPNTAFAPRTVTVQGSSRPGTAAARSCGRGSKSSSVPIRASTTAASRTTRGCRSCPKPLTKLTWDNAALISPATAARLALISGDVVELQQGDRTIRIPVWLAPGQAPDTLTLHLGYGRTRAGRAGNGTGFNVNPLRTTGGAWTSLPGVQLSKTGETYELASHAGSLVARRTQPRPRRRREAQFAEDPQFAQKMEHQPLTGLTMYGDFKYQGYAWGMAIDQNVCTGCNACVVACQAENNVPVVGKSQVLNGREMHWLRVDRYYTGDIENPDTYHQPMPCQQCENAPCEVVCPVAATVHSDEGLNDMVYNRCVGTRYCSNNCPYKVRRFNFLLYQDWDTPSLWLQRNPDVTVRSRGVMEKCTYCVQRINHARDRGQARGPRDSRRRGGDRLPVGVPDRGDRVRQHQRSEQPRRAAEERARSTTRCWPS